MSLLDQHVFMVVISQIKAGSAATEHQVGGSPSGMITVHGLVGEPQ